MRVWSPHDYVSPGLVAVSPDDAFPGVAPREPGRNTWPFLRRDVPHLWYADQRQPGLGLLSRDEAVLLHNVALAAGPTARVVEIGSWIGWSTAHLALANVHVDAIEPAWIDSELRDQVAASLQECGVRDRVRMVPGASPDAVADLGEAGARWALAVIDGDHESSAPTRDVLACLPYLEEDCTVFLHDLASPDVADALSALEREGFRVAIYQTAQVVGIAWRGTAAPVPHQPDPDVAWQLPTHLTGFPVIGPETPDARRPADRRLTDLDAGPERERPSVCIVTGELLGPFRNGGIGTSMSGLAEALAAEGFPVTVLYTGSVWTPDLDLDPWRERYRRKGIALDALTFSDLTVLAGPVRDSGFTTPSLVARYLDCHPFDIVHVNDCCGDGSLALAAHALGLAHRETLFVLALHSPSEWVISLNRTLPAGLLFSAYSSAERLSARCADLVWSPSQYMLDWARDAGFRLPEQTFVQHYTLPEVVGATAPAPEPSESVQEIVFFGRLEERKGLRMFCNALGPIAGELAARRVTVTFLGKPQRCADMPADTYIAHRAKEWPFPCRILPDLDREQALAYVRRPGRVAVMASPHDNSPCTVYEALALGIPFVAARAGGIPELIAPDDGARVLFDPTSDGLHRALRRVLEGGAKAASPAVAPDRTRRALITMFERHMALRRPPPPEPAPQRWAAAVVDHGPGDDLEATLRSLAQTPWVRDVLVLDRAGGTTAAAPSIDLTRSDAADGVRRILGLAGDDILLVHSGVVVLIEPLHRMLGALSATALDGLIAAARVRGPSGETRFVAPIGGSASFALFAGATYTGAILLTRAALAAAAKQGEIVPDAPFLGLADLCTATCDVWPSPEVAFELSMIPTRLTPVDPARVAAYAEASALDLRYMLATGFGAYVGAPSAGRRREVAIALIDAGLGSGVRLASRALRHARAVRARTARSSIRARVHR